MASVCHCLPGLRCWQLALTSFEALLFFFICSALDSSKLSAFSNWYHVSGLLYDVPGISVNVGMKCKLRPRDEMRMEVWLDSDSTWELGSCLIWGFFTKHQLLEQTKDHATWFGSTLKMAIPGDVREHERFMRGAIDMVSSIPSFIFSWDYSFDVRNVEKENDWLRMFSNRQNWHSEAMKRPLDVFLCMMGKWLEGGWMIRIGVWM